MSPTDSLERELRRAVPDAGADLPELTDAALSAGLLDVAYAELDSPLGRLLLASTPKGLVRLAYVDFEDEAEVLG